MSVLEHHARDAAPAAGPRRLSAVAVWALPGLLALVLCLIELGRRSLWLDEGASLAIAAQRGDALWRAVAHDGGNMVLYYLGLHGLIASFGDAISLLRLPSAPCAAATAALVAVIGERALLSRRAGLIAGVLAAVSLPLVFWGQDIRGYAPLVLFVTAAYACLAELAREGPRRRDAVLWGLYAASMAMAIGCGLAALLVLPAQALWLGRRRELWRPFLVAVGAVAVVCAPVFVLAAERGSSQLFWVGRPTLSDLAQAAEWLTSAGLPPSFGVGALGVVLLAGSLAGLVAVCGGALLRRSAGGRVPGVRLAAAWLLVPLVLELVESLAGQPVLLTRNSLVALPAVAVLGAAGLSDSRVPWRAAAVTLVALLALRAAVLIDAYGRSPEDWRGASAYVLRSAAPGDCIAFYPQDGRMPFAAYVERSGARSSAPRPVLPRPPWAEVRSYVESYDAPSAQALAQIARRCPRLWLLSSHAGQRAGTSASRRNYARGAALTRQLGGLYGGGRVRRFGYAAVIRVELFGRRR